MKYRSSIQFRIKYALLAFFIFLQSFSYIGTTPLSRPQPNTAHSTYTPSIIIVDNPVQQQTVETPPAPVLKQVTSADMQAINLKSPCGFSADEMESVTKYNLCGLGSIFAAQDNKVNAVFLMSVAALESGWGRHKLNAYNLFGIYKYQPPSYAECISHTADLLSASYLTEGGPWYNGVTVAAVNVNYCLNPDGSPKASWTDQVSSIMADMYNQIYQAEYQQALSKIA